jgi:alkylation response protein AidB-like acyl-CoA dehydrogenase
MLTIAQGHPGGIETVHQTRSRSDVMADVQSIASGPLRKLVRKIDQEGYYPLDIMGDLGRVGALSAHLSIGGNRLGLAIEAMQVVSRTCGSTGFLMWAHDVCGIYLEQSGKSSLVDGLLPDHAAGRSFGGTALSNPMKAFSGIEKMALRADRVEGGYVVSGSLPWVSHIGPGQYCGAIASVLGRDSSVSHEIVFLLRCDDHVELRTCPHFSGMEGTSTWGIGLENYFVDDGHVIADPAKPLIGKIRNEFILLQTGMALGVIEGSIDSMRDVEPSLGHVNQYLHNRPDELQVEFDELRSRILLLAETSFETDRDYTLNVLDARAQAAELALKASQSALLHQGARGYLMSSAPQRRIREAHFVAIVTPAIKHIRLEMERLSKEIYPS